MSRRTVLVTVSVLAGSCVLGHDSDRPVLSVDPIWDAASGGGFVPETCKGAGVEKMTWEIQDEDGKRLKRAEEPEDCAPLDFFGLDRGTYQLVLEGYDADEHKRWENTCSDLALGRFDILYACEVDQVAPPGEDAGVPDGGE